MHDCLANDGVPRRSRVRSAKSKLVGSSPTLVSKEKEMTNGEKTGLRKYLSGATDVKDFIAKLRMAGSNLKMESHECDMLAIVCDELIAATTSKRIILGTYY